MENLKTRTFNYSTFNIIPVLSFPFYFYHKSHAKKRNNTVEKSSVEGELEAWDKWSQDHQMPMKLAIHYFL